MVFRLNQHGRGFFSSRRSGGITIALALLLIAALSSRASAYVEAPYTLGRICNESTNIMVLQLEKVDKEKNLLVYRKIRDLKGTQQGDTIKHNIGTQHGTYNVREWQYVMQWAEVGQTAVFFHNGGAGETCINGYWYQVEAGGEWWVMSHGEPFMQRSFWGKPDKCAQAVQQMLAGNEVLISAMADGDRSALELRTAKVWRLKASLKIQDYDPKRDFAGWGVEEFKAIALPGFTHIAVLPALGSGVIGVNALDFDGDGKTDFCIYGTQKISLLQNGGGSLNEIPLPIPGGGGARAIAWADYNGDGKPDLLAATPTGPRLLTNLGEARFKDSTSGLPTQDYYNLTAAAWLDYDGDKKPDILLADGFKGLRLYRNLGAPSSVPLQLTFGKWQQCGPFDNTGNKGYDTVYPPENGIDLKGEYPGKNNQKATWRDVEFPDGQLNGVKIYREEDHAFMTIYLHREITANKPADLPISLGSGGPLAVWLDGKKVLDHNVQHAPAPDQVHTVLKLKAGVNQLLIKACFVEHGRETYFKATPPSEATPPLFEDVSDKVGLGSGGPGGAVKGDCLLVADVNGDGRPDILYAAGNGILLLNTPGGFVESKDSGLSFTTGHITPIFADFFGDKRAHLLVPQHDGVKLFRNDGKGHFTDVTAKSGDLAKLSCDASCAAAADFTGQGRMDILIGCMRGANHLLRNNGDGTFTDMTDAVGLDQRIFNTRATAVLDFNRDGAPDVIFVNEGQDSGLLLGKMREPAVADAKGDSADAKTAMASMAGGLDPSAGGGSSSGTMLRSGLAVGGLMIFFGVIWAFIPRRSRKAAATLVLLLTLPGITRADWPTSRGNPSHTGTDDNLPGPKAPKVRWVFKGAQENFIASPVPADKSLLVSSLGALNSASSFRALTLDPAAAERMNWAVSSGFIGNSIVAAPAVADGLCIFGDGTHETDGATLFCFAIDTGRPIWQYDFPGKLVHMEGAPTIDKGKVYLGGGNAGVVCVDINNITVDGNQLNTQAVRFMMDKKWADLQAKYEIDKKKDGDLAIAPDEKMLPKAQPKLLWQKGKDTWHVDAAVSVSGDRLIAASAYVDEDKAGKRALECLKLEDGSTIWETPLDVNPWGGPTLSGDLILVACSNIRFDKKLLPTAKGQIVAVELATGKVRWKKDVSGGVLSPTAVSENVAVFTATDGKVYAWDAATGNERWTYDAKTPFFAGVAISAGVVYAADLKGTLHAISLADGKPVWTFSVTSDPMVASPGMVFTSPVVHGGDIFLATNRIEGEASQQPLAVVCLSDHGPSTVTPPTAKIVVDLPHKTIRIPARIAPRKLAYLKDIYPLEVIACWPHPLGQKAHETVVNFDAKPSDIHNALVAMGLKPGHPDAGPGKPSQGPEVDITISIPGLDGKPRELPLEKVMAEPRTGKPLPKIKWIFTGSSMVKPDPDKPTELYGADMTGTLISIVPVTDETVFQTNLTMKEEPLLKLEDNINVLPPVGTPVELIIRAK
ncbi:MAG TPA: FG-GAP-like repeat-containing protein [Tepidisphaeraceae bacterium]|nr:FG-GAP-like repeat-containing protein [Tepidisphaeraceae bacterium]